MRTWRLTLLGLLAAATAAFAATREGETVDRSVLNDGRTTGNIYTLAGAGETEPLPRSYEIAPPLVPHDVSKMTIRRGTNACLDCHLEGGEVNPGHVATRVPPSHFTNGYTGETRKVAVTGMRFQCLQCHVPQTRTGK